MSVSRGIQRAVLTAAAAGIVVLGWTSPASAHVEVEADKTQAGATDVTLSFSAESESNSAGIVSIFVALPPGIAPSEVSLVSGPTGWAFSTAIDGYTVAGPALPVGQDAEYQVKLAKLPTDSASLPFKTLQTYSDGRIDRWIGIQEPGGPEPSMPAPVLAVQGAVPAPSATSPAPSVAPSSPEPSAAQSSPAQSSPAPVAAADNGSSAGWIIGGVAVLVVVAGLVVWLVRRRATTPSGPPPSA